MMTKERPIIFSGEMVRAILDGRKTATRRAIKQAKPSYTFAGMHPQVSIAWFDDENGKRVAWPKCPYGRPGDLLYVRETWAALGDKIAYRADGIGPHNDLTWRVEKWKPSIHMPKWASRLTLRVTAVRVERVQDIDNHNSWREGIPEYYDTSSSLWIKANPTNKMPDGTLTVQARDVFSFLWDSINAKRGYSWDSNPFVWVVEFEVVD